MGTEKKPGLQLVGKNGKAICGFAKVDKSGPCQNQAGWRTDHVGFGACQYHGGNSKNLRIHAARLAAAEVARELKVEPGMALLRTVHMAAGVVDWIQNQMQQLPEDGVDQATVWMKLYGEERDRLTKAAATCIAAGLQERQVKLAEEQGRMLSGAIRAILSQLGLTAEQQLRAPQIVRTVLQALPMASSDG